MPPPTITLHPRYIHHYPSEDSMVDVLVTRRCEVNYVTFYKMILPCAHSWSMFIDEIRWEARLGRDNHHPFFPYLTTVIWDSTCFMVEKPADWDFGRLVVNGHYGEATNDPCCRCRCCCCHWTLPASPPPPPPALLPPLLPSPPLVFCMSLLMPTPPPQPPLLPPPRPPTSVRHGHADWPCLLVLLGINFKGDIVFISGLHRSTAYDANIFEDTRHLHPQYGELEASTRLGVVNSLSKKHPTATSL